MRDLVIFGAGGFAREVYQIVRDLNTERRSWNFLGFLDGNRDLHGQTVHDAVVLGGAEWIRANPGVSVAVAVGSPATKRRIVQNLVTESEVRFATLVHPRAWIGSGVSLGAGTIVCAGNLLTTDIRIGRHVILNLDCTVGHDAVIEDYCTLAPSVNVSGNVVIHEGCDVGTGAVVIQGIGIREWSTIGAGAAVVRSLPPNVTAVGVPAKPVKQRPEGWHQDP